MELKSLDEVREEVERLARRIGAERRHLPHFGRSDGWGTPHIEVGGGYYHWVIQERGTEIDRHSTRNLDELLEVIFRSVTATMATTYESQHRVPGQDPRRLLFARQLDLLEQLSPEWRKRQHQLHLNTLMSHPYRDG
ncbi:MAG: Imm63 family immunity protein [Fimbriimonas sp.]